MGPATATRPLQAGLDRKERTGFYTQTDMAISILRKGDKMPIEKIEAALEDIRRGKMVILVDDENRENQGDLAMAAEFVTPGAVNFMAREGCGLICLTLIEERADHLDLPLMVRENTSSFGTAFTVSIEARRGVTTGISAVDRATTIRVAIADETGASDLSRPGHVFPLRARRGEGSA